MDIADSPKVMSKKNESEEETALRETLEETSIHTQINSAFRYEISYQLENGNTKTVVYFLAKFQNQTPKRNKDFEDFSYLILPFEEAYQQLTFENTKQILKEVNDFLTSAAPQASSDCQAKCNTFFKKSFGDKKPRHLRGRLLIRETTASNCSCVTLLKSVPLGKKKRTNPFMFSLLPRCQGE